jgi:pimeloyl-ACP methyl ester carboxylesterase
MISGSYNGRFAGDDSITGMWNQGGAKIPLNFSRSSENVTLKKKSFLLPNEREIAIGSLHGVTLYGTLMAKNNKQDLAIIIAGSGPTDRDGNNPLGVKASSYKMLAQSLDSQNISSFRYDKRGIGKSIPGDFKESNIVFDDYIKDAEIIFSFMHDSLGYKNIYFIGHSEGSLIGMVASEQQPVAGYISLAGAGRPIDAVLEEQIDNEPMPDSLKKKATFIFNELKKGHEVNDVPNAFNNIFRKSIQPYMISWLKYDPSKEIKKLNCPVLIIQGSCDNQVKVKDAEDLHKANPKSTLELIPLMTHTLKNADPGCVDVNGKTYSDPSLPLNKILVGDIVSFIKKNE